MANQARHARGPRETVSSLGRRLIGAVLTAGALAAAISAILALWPSSEVGDDLDTDDIDVARIVSADVVPGQPLSEYEESARINPKRERSLGWSPDGLVAAADEPSTSPSGPQPSPTGSEPVEQPPTSRPPSGSVSAPPILDVSAAVRDRLNRDVVTQPVLDDYLLPVDPLPTVSTSAPPIATITVAEALGMAGTPLPPKVAARKLAAKFEQMRSRPRQGKRDLLGASVSVNLEMQGMKGRPLLLYWRLLSVHGDPPLPKGWGKPVPAARLTPGTNHDTANVEVWVPLPKARGRYKVDLTLFDQRTGARLHGLRTAGFR